MHPTEAKLLARHIVDGHRLGLSIGALAHTIRMVVSQMEQDFYDAGVDCGEARGRQDAATLRKTGQSGAEGPKDAPPPTTGANGPAGPSVVTATDPDNPSFEERLTKFNVMLDMPSARQNSSTKLDPKTQGPFALDYSAIIGQASARIVKLEAENARLQKELERSNKKGN